ncbi:MAG: hypothetical protein WA208_07815 [Thermoanaerobaculia bacterium]
MIKNLAVSAALLLSLACASTPMTQSEGGAAAGVATSASSAPDFILLSSSSAVRQYDAISPVYSLHVRGTMTSAGFIPVGQVQGRGKLCADGKDWLSIRDLKTHKASDGTAPVAPYLLGCAAGSSFTPATRDIVMQ